MIGGLFIATSNSGPTLQLPGAMEASAMPRFDYGSNRNMTPFGSLLNQTINDTVYVTKTDTVVVTGRDTVWVPKREVIYKKVRVTKKVKTTDTLYVPRYSQEQHSDTLKQSEVVDSTKNISFPDKRCHCGCML